MVVVAATRSSPDLRVRCCWWELLEFAELFAAETSLTEDRVEGPGREVAVTVHRNDDELRCVAESEVVMAAAHVHDLEPGALERAHDCSAAEARKRGSGGRDLELDQLRLDVSVGEGEPLFRGGLEVAEDRLACLRERFLASVAVG